MIPRGGVDRKSGHTTRKEPKEPFHSVKKRGGGKGVLTGDVGERSQEKNSQEETREEKGDGIKSKHDSKKSEEGKLLRWGQISEQGSHLFSKRNRRGPSIMGIAYGGETLKRPALGLFCV